MERLLPSLKIPPYDAEADTSALDREIDQLVYALFGLAVQEIKLVAGGAKRKSRRDKRE